MSHCDVLLLPVEQADSGLLLRSLAEKMGSSGDFVEKARDESVLIH